MDHDELNHFNGFAIDLGKLEYFPNLNLAAIKGDDSPNPNHHLPGEREQ